MKPPHQHRRIDLTDQKAEIIKKLGTNGSKQYFYYLSRFLNSKVSKVEFNKLCLKIVGRENLPLHNRFVHSIVKNACSANIPPPKEEYLKSVDKHIERNESLLSNGDIISKEFGDPKLLKYSNSNIKLENGDLSRKSLQHHQVLENDSQKESICSQDRIETRKKMPLVNSAFSINGLLENSALRERMEKIVLMQGIKGVTMDCASLLNKGLDIYLKGLISSGVELAGSRLGSEPTQCYTNKQKANLKLINGVTQNHQHQNKLGNPFYSLSLIDFKVAMELNPQQLGEDWPLQLEKICTHTFDEE